MEITQSFRDLLDHNNRNLGEPLIDDKMNTRIGTTVVRFVQVSENRGKLVYVQTFSDRGQPDQNRIKEMAIKKICEEPPSELRWLLPGTYHYFHCIVNAYEKTRDTLIETEHKQDVERATFRRVLKTLSGRRFNPYSLEFDIQKKPRDTSRNLASLRLKEKLQEYRLQPEKSGLLSCSTEELELSVRTYNLLKKYDIQTVGELVYTRDFFLKGKLGGVGHVTEKELQEEINFIIEQLK